MSIELEEIEKEAAQIKEWHEKYQHQLEHHYKEIDEKLQNGSIEKREQILELFQDQQFQSIFYQDAAIAQMSIILGIYQTEKEDKKEHTILDQGNSIGELTEYFLKLKFKIWRLEMQLDEESKKLFLDFVSQYNVTLHAIKFIIHTSSFDKANTAFKIGCLLKNQQQAAMAFGMFNYALELCPGEDIILCEMADICFLNKQYETAKQLIAMVENKTGILEEYMRKWGETE